ncbi:4'-phosphopantetheinyl transferase superfamily protein [Paraflavisolibacter sp. H34]|uniref:4'-phosphopantetheinyl transferase family protein n=1 Tax=Huijunlia imazamoxiresistens TaxID=3127457 RepID=UPI003018541D
MPIYFQKDITEDTKLGIWRIEEEEAFFRLKVLPQRNVSHPHKNLQHLAGRYLLKHLFPEFPVSLILVADTRKPYLQDEAYHFSISHCSDYAAAIVSKTQRVGVDIEVPSVKVERIRHKFLGVDEPAAVEWIQGNGQWATVQGLDAVLETPAAATVSSSALLTLLWSCKEAVFKWYGVGEVDFRQHICVQRVRQISETVWETEVLFRKGRPVPLTLHSYFFPDAVISFVVTEGAGSGLMG